MNQVTLQKLQTIYSRAAGGDDAARKYLAQCRAAALAGSAEAREIHNTMAVLHWRKRNLQPWSEIEKLHSGLMRRDTEAKQAFKSILTGCKRGDKRSKQLFAALKAIHNQRKSGLWSNTTAGWTSTGATVEPLTPNALLALIQMCKDARNSVPQLPTSMSSQERGAMNPMGDDSASAPGGATTPGGFEAPTPQGYDSLPSFHPTALPKLAITRAVTSQMSTSTQSAVNLNRLQSQLGSVAQSKLAASMAAMAAPSNHPVGKLQEQIAPSTPGMSTFNIQTPIFVR